ncbi:MAG: diguanylate cyclase, partial [Anaerolineae bacterium]|nr:diguanylate cyclase [Anaerolineae bacterium]
RKHESYHACDDGALSEICVPLKIGGQVLGSLNLENQELDSFSENDLRMLIILANNLSIIIKNSQLYEDTARLKRFNENIVQGVTESILVENADGYFTFVNPALEKLLGYSQDELLGHHWTKIVPKYAVEQILHEMAAPRKEHQRQYETVIQNKAGEIIPILVSARSFFESEIYTGALSILTNIAERVQMEEKLHQQATTDPLTKVFNRRYFFDLAQQELERSQRYDRPLSIIIFDIDHFKKVNDTHGHAVGDEVLRQLSERCQKTLRENDILARYGGEEFIILLPETPQEQAKQMAERMRINCAETPFNNELAPVKLTISFGLSSFAPTLPLDELLLRADKALYLAKEGGRNRVSVWEVEK